jgi:D-alanyl-D-alanine dipeptidase
VYRNRVGRVQATLQGGNLDYLFLSISPDLFYLTGYMGHASERLHMLVIPPEGRSTIVFPAFETSMIDHLAEWMDVVGWEETEDPVAAVRAALQPGDRDRALRVGIGDQTRAVFLLRLQEALPQAHFSPASGILAPMRRVKDGEEIRILKEAQDMAGRALERLREVGFAGRSERQIAVALKHICDDLGYGEGFGAAVGSGPNGALPHLAPSDRVIRRGDPVVVDFWATYNGYYSDCTRALHVGPPSDEFRRVFGIVDEANAAALAAVRPGVTCQSIDRAAREVISAAGYGEFFTHRLGHGVGIDIHEEPWMVEGNELLLEPGMTFTDEPGIYLPGKFGCRIEDVLAVTETGGIALTDYPHEIIVVD